VLRVESHRVGKATPDRVHAERSSMKNADDPRREREHARGVNVVAEPGVQESQLPSAGYIRG